MSQLDLRVSPDKSHQELDLPIDDWLIWILPIHSIPNRAKVEEASGCVAVSAKEHDIQSDIGLIVDYLHASSDSTVKVDSPAVGSINIVNTLVFERREDSGDAR